MSNYDIFVMKWYHMHIALLSRCCRIVDSLLLHWCCIVVWIYIEEQWLVLCENNDADVILLILKCWILLMNYMLIIIECEISPLLFECCLYVGNVQITRSNRWCELIPRVVLGVALIRNGMGIYMLDFPSVMYFLLKLLLDHFRWKINKLMMLRSFCAKFCLNIIL